MDDSGNKKSNTELSDEKIEAAAKECGLELTEEQLAKLKEASPREEKGELTDEELEAVAGGDLKDKLKKKIKELLF